MYDIIVVGAGPSGLSAAITASMKRPDFNILVLEKEAKCGRKLSASGNGKCNAANAVFDKSCYHSLNKDYINMFTSGNATNDVIDFFKKIGIILFEKNGYYYPTSNQARQVTDIMIEQCRHNGVEISVNSCVTGIEYARKDGGYRIITEKDTHMCRNIIIATGSNAAPKLSGSMLGYELIKSLGINVTELYPGLSPVYVDDKDIHKAKGVRLDGTVTFKASGVSCCERGQIQFNEDNLSGIALMNISCYIPYISPDEYNDSIYIDIMPYMTWDKLKEFFFEQQNEHGDKSLFYTLEGLFPNGFVNYLTARLHMNPDSLLASLNEKHINRLTSAIKKLTYTPILQTDYNKAQVTLGGVDLSEINVATFESVKYPGMYLVGEELDMTGKCGGYNITFAILSGIAAGDGSTLV